MPMLKFCVDCTASLGVVHTRRMRCDECRHKMQCAAAARWKKNNPEKHKQICSDWRKTKGREYIRAYENAWNAANREKHRARTRRCVLAKRQLIIPKAKLFAEQNQLLAEVRSLVPRGHPAFDDVCGDILLAIINGSITMKMLRADPKLRRMFSTAANKMLFEKGGFGVDSTDMPMRDGRNWHDVLGSSPEE